jgi:phosphatidylglycerophosphate synthase
MWYRMNTFQQKILGIAGMLLFSFLFISILVESKLLKSNLEILAVAIIVVLIISFILYLLSSHDFIKSQ